MSWLDGMRHRLRTLFRSEAYERELREEMELHLELDAMQVGDAWAARRRFGNRTGHAEETRRAAGMGWLDALRQDVGYAARSLRRSPGVSLLIVGVLALGIGANAATFSMLDELYLRPPRGVETPATLRRIYVKHTRTGGGNPFTSQALHYPLYQAIAGVAGDSTDIAIYETDWSLRMGGDLEAPKVRVVYASANYFSVVGVSAAQGRLFAADEGELGKGVPIAVVSDAFWRDKLGARRSALGETILIGRTPHTVVGVLTPRFRGLDIQGADVWVPLATLPQPTWMREPWWRSTSRYALRAVARVPAEFDDETFSVRATLAARRSNRELNGVRADTLMTVASGSIIEARGPGVPGQELLISTRLSGGAVLLLVIACANVVNLLLLRALARRREIALRLALGVSRAQLMRLLAIDALLLTTMATCAALVVARWGGAALRALLMPEIEWTHASFDARIVTFTVAVGTIAGLIAAVIPSVQASRADVASALAHSMQGGGTRHRSRLRQSLVVLQASLAVVLLCGSTLVVRSLRNVQAVDLGFDVDQILFASLRFADGERPPAAEVARSMNEVAERLRTRPGVESVARIAMEPMRGFTIVNFYTGRDSAGSFAPNEPTLNFVSPEFFEASGLRLLEGRGFSEEGSGPAPREVVVNEAMARAGWQEGTPVGACIAFERRDAPCYTVVGIAETAHRDGVIESALPQYYVSLSNPPYADWFGTTLLVRTTPALIGSVSTDVRSLLRAEWPSAAPTITPMLDNLEPEYRPWRTGATLFTTFSAIALLVAIAGIYGVVAFGVSQRRREFGVRMALGAKPVRVMRQVLTESSRTILVGITLGLAVVLAMASLLSDLLYGISPRDPVTLLGAGALLLSVAAAAALVPAWRAMQVNPVETMRADS